MPLSPAAGDTIGDIILKRYHRREVLRGALGVAAATALFGPALLEERRGLGGRRAGSLRVRGGRGRRRRDPPCRRGLPGRHLAPLGRPALSRFAAIRPVAAKRRRAVEAVRLQQRLYRLHPARRQRTARPAVHQSRIHQRGGHVSRPRPPGLDLLSRHDGGAGRDRNGRPWRHHRRDRARGRPVAPGAGQHI